MPKKLSADEINSRLATRGIKMIGDDVAVAKTTTFQCCRCMYKFPDRLSKILYKVNTQKGEFCRVCDYHYRKNILLGKYIEVLTPVGQYVDSRHKVQVRCMKCRQTYTNSLLVLCAGHRSSSCGCTIQVTKRNQQLKGVRVGYVLIISNLVYRNEKGYTCVRGLCDCGTMIDLELRCIRLKKKKDRIGCPQCNKEHARQSVLTWKIGQKFGTLTIISDSTLIKANSYVQTKCDCGNIERSATIDLTLGRKKICTKCRLEKHLKYNRDRTDRYLALFGATRITEYIPNGNRQISYICKCGKENKIYLSHLQQIVDKHKTLLCRCEKIKNGVSTSNAAISLYDNLDRGVHNFQAKCGNIDIALGYKGKKVAIEYDEWWWHKDKKDRDKRKTIALLNDGWYVLRLRVSGYVPNRKFLYKALNRLIKTPSRLLLLTHKSWHKKNKNKK